MTTEITAGVSLTDAEQALVDHVTRGELLDLANGEPVDEAAMRAWGSSRTIRAAVLRDILLGRLAPDPDPHGLQLRGARIAGQLDLKNLTTNVGMELSDCLLGEGLVARDATLPFLVLSGCRLEHPSKPPLDARRLTATALVLARAVITADCTTGAVRLGAPTSVYWSAPARRCATKPAPPWTPRASRWTRTSSSAEGSRPSA
jgi:hypothetical protein